MAIPCRGRLEPGVLSHCPCLSESPLSAYALWQIIKNTLNVSNFDHSLKKSNYQVVEKDFYFSMKSYPLFSLVKMISHMEKWYPGGYSVLLHRTFFSVFLFFHVRDRKGPAPRGRTEPRFFNSQPGQSRQKLTLQPVHTGLIPRSTRLQTPSLKPRPLRKRG